MAGVVSFSGVFLALSPIAEDFGVTLRQVSWVAIIQSLTVTAVMLPLGRVADLTGRRRFHLVGLAILGLGSLASAMAPDLPTLILARFGMSVGATMLQSISAAIISSVFPANERGRGLGYLTTCVAFSGALGPALGGFMLQVWSWPAIFFFTALLCVGAYWVADRHLRDDQIGSFEQPRGTPYDWLGAVLSGTAIAALILAVTNPFSLAWNSPTNLTLCGLSVGAFTLFLRWELRSPAPMLPLRLFRNPTLCYAMATRVIAFGSISSSRVLVPVLLISLLGIAPGLAGLIMLNAALGMGSASLLSGRLSDRFGYRPFALVGFVLMPSTAVIFMLLDPTASLLWVALTMFASGLGMGVWSAPNTALIMNAVPASDLGVAGALVGLARNLGNVFGQALVAAVVSAVMLSRGFDIPLGEVASSAGASSAFLAGWKVAFGVVFAMGVGGLALVLIDTSKQEAQSTQSTFDALSDVSEE